MDLQSNTIARGLGWISIGLGVTELLAAEGIDRFLGTGEGENAGLIRALGVRELAHGIDILSHDDPTPGVWSRVAGDLLDGAMLGLAATESEKPGNVALAAALVAPVVLADIAVAMARGTPR